MKELTFCIFYWALVVFNVKVNWIIGICKPYSHKVPFKFSLYRIPIWVLRYLNMWPTYKNEIYSTNKICTYSLGIIKSLEHFLLLIYQLSQDHYPPKSIPFQNWTPNLVHWIIHLQISQRRRLKVIRYQKYWNAFLIPEWVWNIKFLNASKQGIKCLLPLLYSLLKPNKLLYTFFGDARIENFNNIKSSIL